MKIVVVFNPVSGAGRSQATARSLAEQLEAAGHTAALAPTRLGSDDRWLDDDLKDAAVAVVVGGDGAVRLAAGPAARQQVPVYHLPCGTENLFAREFGMDSSAERVIKSINAMNTRRVDLGRANGRQFVLMCSVGYDAEVVHHLASRRGSAISHRSYIWPMIRQFLRWTPPTLTIQVDGTEVVHVRRGVVIVANSRQYAWRMDPVLPADMADGQLDVLYLPMRTRLGLFAWAIRCFRRRHMQHPQLIHARGRSIRVQSPQAAAYQLDGDPSDSSNKDVKEGSESDSNRDRPVDLAIEVCPAALTVLLPAEE